MKNSTCSCSKEKLTSTTASLFPFASVRNRAQQAGRLMMYGHLSFELAKHAKQKLNAARPSVYLVCGRLPKRAAKVTEQKQNGTSTRAANGTFTWEATFM